MTSLEVTRIVLTATNARREALLIGPAAKRPPTMVAWETRAGMGTASKISCNQRSQEG
jgi:hypothetical protein